MSKGRIVREIGFVLHTWPYRETSLIVDCFTRQYGRIGLIAKGAKRPYSAFRGLLQTFRPLNLSWTGNTELKILTQAEWVEARLMPVGLSWLCGCYLNELILKLLERHDPHPVLFDHYQAMVAALSGDHHGEEGKNARDYELLLRRFERAMLKEIGYEMNLQTDIHHQPIESTGCYRLDSTLGMLSVYPVRSGDEGSFLGQSLLDIACDDYQSTTSRQAAKRLMRHLINHHLAGETLQTRRLLIDLHSF